MHSCVHVLLLKICIPSWVIAATVLPKSWIFIQIAWIFYPDDLDLDFTHQSLLEPISFLVGAKIALEILY